jgi:RND family efflux transporter MFP subunit
VATPVVRNVTDYDEFTGRFEASQRVEIRARVSGYLASVNFKDGQLVRQGDLLFVIDQRPYEIALAQARAQVASAQASLALATADVERAEPLFRSHTMSQRDFETRQTTQRQALGSLQAAQATQRSAELNLEFTQIRAPITGRVSNRRVDIGNLVSGGDANSTLLTTLVAVDPIYFTFEGSEADYLKYTRLISRAERLSADRIKTPVFVKLADERNWTHEGHLDFVDNALSTGTATIRVRAVIPNPNALLAPGLFGRIRVPASQQPSEAVLVPDAAIVSDQARKVVYALGPDDTVTAQPVALGQLHDGLRAVEGLKPDTRIVIDGLLRVRPGQKVNPKPGTIEPGAAPRQEAAR